MMKILPILVATLALAGPARADWQWARWGMTPTEVVAAADGTAELIVPKGSEDDRGGVTMATGRYSAGPFTFAAEFDFYAGRLARVRLTPPPDQCGNLEYWLVDKYGELEGRTRYDGLYEWRDPLANTGIVFSQTGTRAAPACFLRYSALEHEGNRGL